MTATQTRDRPLGTPIRSFLLVIVLLFAALSGVQASGAVRPQLRSLQGQSGTTVDQRRFAAALVRNTGRLPVRIEDVRFELEGWTEVDAVILAPGTTPSADGAAPQTVSSAKLPGSSRVEEGTWVMVTGRPPCAGAPEDLVVNVRTWSGIERSVLIPDIDPDGARPGCP